MKEISLLQAMETAVGLGPAEEKERTALVSFFNDSIEINTRQLADALKGLYPPGGVAVYGENDQPGREG